MASKRTHNFTAFLQESADYSRLHEAGLIDFIMNLLSSEKKLDTQQKTTQDSMAQLQKLRQSRMEKAGKEKQASAEATTPVDQQIHQSKSEESKIKADIEKTKMVAAKQKIKVIEKKKEILQLKKVKAETDAKTAVDPAKKAKAQEEVKKIQADVDNWVKDIIPSTKKDLEKAKSESPPDEEAVAGIEADLDDNREHVLQLKLSMARVKADGKGIPKEEYKVYNAALDRYKKAVDTNKEREASRAKRLGELKDKEEKKKE